MSTMVAKIFHYSRQIAALTLLTLSVNLAVADTDSATLAQYQKSCGICHTSGAAGAPRTGDMRQWEPRLAKGMPTLIRNVQRGLGAMPPMGMCPTCTAQEIEQLIVYMTGMTDANNGAAAEKAPPTPTASLQATDPGNRAPAEATLTASQWATAQEASDEPSSNEPIDKAQQIRIGQAKSASCVACHGSDGNSPSSAFPKLAGQNEHYLIKQMQDIQCANLSSEQQKQTRCTPRLVPTMIGQLDGMSPSDLAAIAAYYSSQAPTAGQADPQLVALGQAIYRGGIREKNIPACSACHSPVGQGNAPAGFPRLAGQHAAYTAAQLKAYRAAADGDPAGRANDGDTEMMRTIAYRLSDREIEAVSTYIQGLY